MRLEYASMVTPGAEHIWGFENGTACINQRRAWPKQNKKIHIRDPVHVGPLQRYRVHSSGSFFNTHTESIWQTITEQDEARGLHMYMSTCGCRTRCAMPIFTLILSTSRQVQTIYSSRPYLLIKSTQDRREREIAILRILDSIGFNWPVFCAVAIGFLASSYSLFATNIISPALLYVYPPGSNLRSKMGQVLDLTTLSSTLVGMVVFGHFADRGGRKRLYGWELIIIILATMGLVLSSKGIMGTDEHGNSKSSMDIYASIIFFRCVLGFGIGAEVSHPISRLTPCPPPHLTVTH